MVCKAFCDNPTSISIAPPKINRQATTLDAFLAFTSCFCFGVSSSLDMEYDRRYFNKSIFRITFILRKYILFMVKTIKLSDETHKRLGKRGTKHETYEDVIKKLLDMTSKGFVGVAIKND